MGVKKLIAKAGAKAADKVAKLAVLSPEQLQDLEAKREAYLNEKPSMDDANAVELTRRLMAANSVEIYNAYLEQIKELYQPIEKDSEFDNEFDVAHNIRFIEITKWVSDKKENSLEKLVNVYEVLSNEDCNIALVFHRSRTNTQVYLAITNNKNEDSSKSANDYISRLKAAIRGNFPGAEWKNEEGIGKIPCLSNDYSYSVASVSNIPTEKSEKFISQTIEKLLDGIIPEKRDQEYTVVLLATPVLDVATRKLKLAEFYTGLAPYASWQTDFIFTQSDSTNSAATFGINAGVSAGVQQGTNSSISNAKGTTDSTSETDTETQNQTVTEGEGEAVTDSASRAQSDSVGRTEGTTENVTETKGKGTIENKSKTETDSINGSVTTGLAFNQSGSATVSAAPGGVGASATATTGMSESISATVGTGHSEALSEGLSKSITESSATSTGSSVADTVTKALTSTVGKSIAKNTSKAIADSIGSSIAKTVGQAVSNTVTKTAGLYKGVNFGGNFGANFARSSNITATVGKNEGIHQTFTNYTIKHTLELLEEQMKRYEMSSALGMWDFAAYVMSEDSNIANNVAHTYLALTQGETSHMSTAAVNLWRGDMGENSNDAKEICAYIRELRHPLFGLNPVITEIDNRFNVYPSVVTATTSLSGKELAYSLNFPQKSISGLPVIECAEFGRNITSYSDYSKTSKKINIGKVFHMNHTEKTNVMLSVDSLASHTFITGSTGSGKSNTVYTLINESLENNVKFLVIEPAKGEYKNVFGNGSDVSVYGTNPKLTELLKLNPFSFPNEIHVLEHLDRLVEIFNVCWPMYAAMPAVLKSAIEKSYEDCGWDLCESVNMYGDNLYPCFADVARNIKIIIESSEYDAENQGAYKGSLLTRLNSLSNGINGMIFSDDEIPANILFDENVIIDLSRVGSSETKALLMGMLVLKLQEHRIANSEGANANLKHITVLEEAHNILKRTSTEQSSEGGNLVGKSVEMITNAIAEMRTYGEGFVIVDQAPGLVDMAAIRNTNTKIIMRLPDFNDRELVGRAANLNDDQIQEIAKFPCGVAAVYQNEWIQPVLCKISKADVEERKYNYVNTETVKDADNSNIRLTIATLLSSGSGITGELTLDEIKEYFDGIGAKASVRVSAIQMLLNPPLEPRMTKLAPIISCMFPEINEAVKKCYSESNNPEEWTECAENTLRAITNGEIENQVRRDIIQASITQYLLFERNNKNDLQEWCQRGGLR